MTNTIEIPFGREGYRAMWAKMKSTQKVGEEFDVKKATEAGAWFLIDRLMEEMKEQGYRSIGRGRAVFEDALDWDARFKVAEVVQYKIKYKAVPKVLSFKVSVPKVE